MPPMLRAPRAPDPEPMASRVLQELKRRKVVQVAVVYAVVGFGVAQVAGVMLPNLGLTDWTGTPVFPGRELPTA
jgi:hypothetical protein